MFRYNVIVTKTPTGIKGVFMKNKELRKAITDAGLFYWQVAEQLGIIDGNFSRLLRRELEGEKKRRVLEAIEKAARSNEQEAE